MASNQAGRDRITVSGNQAGRERVSVAGNQAGRDRITVVTRPVETGSRGWLPSR